MLREEANSKDNLLATPTRKRANTSLTDESTPTRKSSRF